MRAENLPDKLLVASPAGFCAGVVRAIEMAEQYAGDGPIVGLHQLIHYKPETDRLAQNGVTFVEEVRDIPEGSRVLVSAHGASPEVWTELAERRVKVLDATCPLVAKVHSQVKTAIEEAGLIGKQPAIIYVCHPNHREAQGVIGEAPELIYPVQKIEDVTRLQLSGEDPKYAFTQTTLSIDDTAAIMQAIRVRYPGVREPKREDICFATQHRQDGVKALIRNGAEEILIVGSTNSSNTARLAELAQTLKVTWHMFELAEEFDLDWIRGVRVVGLTGGASAAISEIAGVSDYLASLGINRELVSIADESRMRFNNVSSVYDFT